MSKMKYVTYHVTSHSACKGSDVTEEINTTSKAISILNKDE